ncbi:serine hydrolase [Streptomyces sp. NPDC002896]|uniref:serine hydrolase n=1 Tax=Streptomyces sp. NPDC002896 TaxID=3154438 RepID=UPI003331CF5A
MHRHIRMVCAITVLVGSLAGCSSVLDAVGVAHSVAVTSSATATATRTASADPSPSDTPTEEATVDPDDRLAEALADVLPDPDGDARLSVAVFALDSGDAQVSQDDDDDAGSGTGSSTAVYGNGSTFDTASIVKVDILAALLLQAQDEGRHLTAQERTYATAMIENSDNASATALWQAIGGADGLNAANERLGLTSTEAGENGRWGLTQTTAEDQLTLLRAVFGTTESTSSGDTSSGSSSELTESSRAYIQELMGHIATDQDWGVSAAAGSGWALKNGWLQRSTTALWDINSIGRVTVDGRQYLVAVLSGGNASKEKGVSLVERAAKAAVSALAQLDA